MHNKNRNSKRGMLDKSGEVPETVPDLTPFSATSIPSTASTQGLVLTSSHFTTCWLMSLIVSRRHVPFPQGYVLFFSCTQTPTANREAYSYTHIRFKIGGSVQQGRSPCEDGGNAPKCRSGGPR